MTKEISKHPSNLLEQAHGAIFLWQIERGILYWNPGAEKLYGWTKEEAAGKLPHQILHTKHPITKHPIEAKDLENLVTKSGHWEGEILRRTRDGRPITIESHFSLVHYGELPNCVLEINHEITFRKAAEEKVSAALKELNDVKAALDEHAIVAITDQRGKIVYVNDKFCAISKYSREELLGQDHRIINSKYHSKEFFHNLWSTIAQGKVWKGAIRNRAKDGSIYWVDTTIVPFLNDKGKPYQYVAIRADITEQKKVEEELKVAQEKLRYYAKSLEKQVAERTAKLQETVAELEAFSYSISHDLRAPLRAMQGFSALLLEDYSGKLDETGSDYLKRIASAAHRLDRLVQDVLTYSRVTRAEFELSPVDLDKLVHEIIEQYPQIKKTHAQITVIGKLPTVLGHEAVLTQCVSNLIGNAVKFVSNGTVPQIKIWATLSDGKAKLWVEDNGIGIPAKDHKRIFNMFERVYSEEEYEGTGVGLAIVRKAIEKIGGTAGVESELEKGSKFWIALKNSTDE